MEPKSEMIYDAPDQSAPAGTPRPYPPTYDAYGRPITYLRVSLTDRCNMQCLYCGPHPTRPPTLRPELLTNEELLRVLRAAAVAGFTKIRLTGGEPTLRPDLVSLVQAIKIIPGMQHLTMSTNGVLLPRLAPALKAAGLSRVNISIDSLDPAKVARLTGWDSLAKVWAGIAAAEDAGLHPIRLNAVVLRGVNDDEIAALAGLTTRHAWEVRFIEMMPMSGVDGLSRSGIVPNAEVIAQIEAAHGSLTPLPGRPHDADRSYRIPGAPGQLGFISSVSEPFCDQCNRMRLTADGRLHLCLLRDTEVDIRAALRSGASQHDLERIIRHAVRLKPWGHTLQQGQLPTLRTMAELGG